MAPFEDQEMSDAIALAATRTAIPIYCPIMTCRVRYFGSAKKPMRAKRSSILEEAKSARPIDETLHMIR